MDLILFEKFVLIIINILGLFLGITAYRSNTKSKTNKYFLLSSIIILIWIDLSFLLNITNDNIYLLIIGRANLAFFILFSLIIYLFILNFPKEKYILDIKNKIIIVFGLIIFLFTLLSPFVVKDITMISQGLSWKFGFGQWLIYLFATYIGFYIVFDLFKKYKISNKIDKSRILYFFGGAILFVCLNVIFNVFVPISTKNDNLAPLGDYSIIFFFIFTSIAIARHHLFNIKVIATQTIVIIISISLLVETLISINISEMLIKLIIWLLATYGGYRLIKSVKAEIEHRKEIERLARHLERTNKNLLTLQHINNKMVSTLDVKRVSQEIVESLTSELSWEGGFLALINDKKEIIFIEAITQKIGKIIIPLLKKPLHKYTLPVRGSDSVIQKSIHRLEIEFTGSLDELVRGAIKSETLKKIQSKLKIETFASAPIVYRGKVIGVLVAGFAEPISKISAEERKMISSIADQAAIAIENAKLYEQIEKANIKLKSLDKLKNEFLSIASHQVRTPLSIIKGYISLIRDKKAGEITEQQDHFMKNIQEANDQLINIINDFLNLSRIEQKRMKLEISESDVQELIEQVIDRLSHEAELKNIKLNFVKETQNIPKINIDEPKIIEVITNLVDNAIKYAPEDSEITISLKKEGNKLFIAVADHGIGIPDEFKDKLFQKFSRAHNAIQHQPNGNGIGLFLVKKIIDAHNGKIKVSSKEDKGTTFIVNLNYLSGLKPGEEIDVNQLEKKGIIRYDEYKS